MHHYIQEYNKINRNGEEKIIRNLLGAIRNMSRTIAPEFCHSGKSQGELVRYRCEMTEDKSSCAWSASAI